MKRAFGMGLIALGLVACSHPESHETASAVAPHSANGIPRHYRRAYPVAMPVDLAALPAIDAPPGAARAAAPITSVATAAQGSPGASGATPPISDTTADTYGALPPTPSAATIAPSVLPGPGTPLTNTAPFVAPTGGPPLPTAMAASPDSNQVVVFDTSFGRFVIELDDFAAPQTCANFRQLVNKGFYDGTIFHRVIPQFIIQGGDPNTKGADRARYGQGDPGYTLPPEIKLHHDRGAVAMARLPDSVNPQRYSNGSQFYICVAPCPSLDDQYTVFGHVISGMDVADRISSQPTDRRSDPLERITMNAILEPRDRALRENASSGP
jgi:peptidyl-prolyl cis-trans isomerase B (cyclophilin B)